MTKEELFFHEPDNIYQKQYEALRAFYYEKKQAKEVAKISDVVASFHNS